MKNLSQLIIFLSIILFPGVLFAQWDGSSNIDGDINRNGSVGIGTSSPTYRFQIVNGDAKLYAIYEGDNHGNGDRLFKIDNANGRVFGINAYHSSTTYNNLITRLGINYSIDGNNSNTQFAIIGSKKAPVIELNAEDGSISLFGENGSGNNWRNSEATMNLGLHVNKDGLVGIETSTPRMPLDIKGKVSIGTQSPTTGSGLEIYHYSNNTSYINSYDRNNSNYLPLSISASEFTFYNGGAKMFIDSDGNVGIGTTSLTNKLEVAGTIRAEEIKVEAAPWADFVFEKDYNLRPLQEVNTYIQQNGHLPEIPTAKEVEENGISLGEMNAKLLQKIEELTLYTIEQEKRIEKLEEIIRKLH